MPTVSNSRAGDVIVEGVHLKPGANQISDEQAKTLQQSAAFKRHARRGWLGGLDLNQPAASAVTVNVQTPGSPAAAPPPEPAALSHPDMKQHDEPPREPPPEHHDPSERKGRLVGSKR